MANSEKTSEPKARPAPGAGHPVAVPVEQCHRCGAPIPPDGTQCPECGRRLYRICYCGWRIPVTAASCPQCQADWSSARRVRKRAHSRKIRPARLGAFAVVGALGALLVVALASRLGDAWPNIAATLALIRGRLSQESDAVTNALLVFVAGAAIGVLLYLVREDILRLPWLPRSHRRDRHHRRRRAR